MDETPVTLTTRPDWWNDAACKGCTPDLFFPGRGDTLGIAAAKAVCAACPVKQTCLDDAMANGEKWGIFGGLSERQRRRLRSEHRPCPTCGLNVRSGGMGSHRAAHQREMGVEPVALRVP